METILGSLRKTMRLAVAHDAHRTLGFGAEIAARCMEEAFDYLDAPVERVAVQGRPDPVHADGDRRRLPGRRRRRRGGGAPRRVTAVTVPQLSISMEDAKVSRWLVEDGAEVAAGQTPRRGGDRQGHGRDRGAGDGRLRIVAAEGEIVAVEGVLGGGRAGRCRGRRRGCSASRAELPAPTAPPPPRRPVAPGGGHVASPAARRLARESAVDLTRLQGSGPGGRIVARDIARRSWRPAAPAAGDRLREAVVRNVTASWQQIPHVHIGGELEADGLVRARACGARRRRCDGHRPARRRPRPRAAGGAGAQCDAGTRTARSSGARRSTSPWPSRPLRASSRPSCATPARATSRRSRWSGDGSSRPPERGALDGRDLTGGTCTLSNLGAYPVDFFAPVVSGPQVAMVATGRVADRAVAVDGLVGVRAAHVGQRRDRPSRGGRRGGRPPPRRARAPDRPARGRLRMTIAPVPVDEAVPGPRPDGLDDSALLALYRADGPCAGLRGRGDRRLRQGPDPRLDAPLHRRRGHQGRGAVAAPRPTTSSSPPIAATARRSSRASIPSAMMAELMGRATGVCKGKGGSMHLSEPSVGLDLDERDRRRAHPDGRRRRPLVPVPEDRAGRPLLLRRRRLVRGRVLRGDEHGHALEGAARLHLREQRRSRSRCRPRRARPPRTSPTAPAASGCLPRSSTATTCSRFAAR